MKKILALLALVLGVVSCQTEPEGLDVNVGGEQEVAVCVSLPETTRANANSAVGAFENVDWTLYTIRYQMKVYDSNGRKSDAVYEQYLDGNVGKSVVFPVRLVPNRDYRFVVWADIVKDADHLDLHYNTADLANITLKGEWKPMDETRDAFTGYFDTVEKGKQYTSASSINIILKRPFAKLRVITTDMKELGYLGINPAYATVEYATEYRAGFNAFTSKAVEAVEDVKKTHNVFQIASYGDNVTTGDKQSKVLFTDYFFAEDDVVKFTLNVYEGKNANGEGTGLIKSNIFNTDIAAKRNYLTTIAGNILTDGNNITVEVKDAFANADKPTEEPYYYQTISSEAELLDAIEYGGEYIVISDIEVTGLVASTQAATRTTGTTTPTTTTINLNGYTINLQDDIVILEGKTVIINNDPVDDAGNDKGAIVSVNGKAIVNNGTLNIEGGSFGANTIKNEDNGVVNITGGEFKDDDLSNFVPDGYDVEDNEDGSYTVTESEPVAKIGDVQYTTLQAAFDAVVGEATITLLRDATFKNTSVLAEGKTAVLDLDGNTLAHADETNKYALSNLGTLTIKDSKGNGSINSRGIYNGYGNGGENVASAKLTIMNGTFNAKGTNGGAAIFNYGIVDVQGGEFTSIGGYSLNNQSGASMTIADGVTANNGVYTTGATLTINGGEISGNRSGCHVIYANNSVVTINGGTFYNNNSGNATVMAAGSTKITYNGGTYGIKDGRVPGNGNTWTSCLLDSANSATVVIIDGTYNGGFRVQAGTSMTINGGSFNDCYGSNYNIYGTVTVKGGTYTDAAAIAFAEKYVADGYMAVDNGDNTSTVIMPAAKVGSTIYTSIDEAIAAWTHNTTLTLLNDVTLSDVITLKSTEHHILNLSTYTLTAAEKKNAIEITPFGDGAGTAAKSCLTINADATTPGGITATGKACIYYNKTNGINDRIMVTINGGVFDGTISSSSNNGGQACPYFVFNGGVFNKSINLTKAMLNVTGGVFHGTFSCTGDSTAYRQISGGRFKSWLFMTADASNKFWVGTAKATYNVGVYVDKEGYLVVGGPVINDFGDKFEAKATNATKWSSYLKYSSAAANGLYYENAAAAIAKHGEANVELK